MIFEHAFVIVQFQCQGRSCVRTESSDCQVSKVPADKQAGHTSNIRLTAMLMAQLKTPGHITPQALVRILHGCTSRHALKVCYRKTALQRAHEPTSATTAIILLSVSGSNQCVPGVNASGVDLSHSLLDQRMSRTIRGKTMQLLQSTDSSRCGGACNDVQLVEL